MNATAPAAHGPVSPCIDPSQMTAEERLAALRENARYLRGWYLGPTGPINGGNRQGGE
jgi:hypothetical protein